MEHARARLLISGLVQGVCFRAETVNEARRRGLSGWVRNLPGGRVEAVAEGPRGAVEQLVQWCRHGPPVARVTQVEVDWGTPAGNCDGFTVRYD